MQEYIYVLRAARPAMLTQGPTPEEQRVVERHSAWLDRLGEEGCAGLGLAVGAENHNAEGTGAVRAHREQ